MDSRNLSESLRNERVIPPLTRLNNISIIPHAELSSRLLCHTQLIYFDTVRMYFRGVTQPCHHREGRHELFYFKLTPQGHNPRRCSFSRYSCDEIFLSARGDAPHARPFDQLILSPDISRPKKFDPKVSIVANERNWNFFTVLKATFLFHQKFRRSIKMTEKELSWTFGAWNNKVAFLTLKKIQFRLFATMETSGLFKSCLRPFGILIFQPIKTD